MSTNGRFIALATMLTICGSASAQIAVPPSDAIPPTKEYVPPAPPVGKPFDPNSQQQPTATPVSAAPVQQPLPELPYTSLAKRDEKGNLPVLSEPIEWAALRVNPTITTPEDKEKVAKILAERLKMYQAIAIDNIDFLKEIDGGMLDKIDVTSPQMKPNVIKIRALAGKSTLTKVMREEKSLTDVQIRFNEKITSERVKAEFDAKPVATTGDKEKDKAAKEGTAKGTGNAVLRQAVSEALHARRLLFVGQAGKIAAAGEKFGMSAEGAKAIGAATTDDAKFEAVRKALDGMPADKQRELLKSVIAG